MSSLPRKGRKTSSDTSNVTASSFQASKTLGKLSTGSFKGHFTSSSSRSQSPSGLGSTARGTSPSISLTTSTGTSSYLHRSPSAASSDYDSNPSTRSSLYKRASDIQSYASRYLDSIRSKKSHHKTPLPTLVEPTYSSSAASTASASYLERRSPTYSTAGTSSAPYLLTFRQGSGLASSGSTTLARPASFLHQRPYSLSPPPTASTSTITSSSSSFSSTSTSSRSNYSEPRWFRHITEASNAYRARDTRGRGRGLYPADPINNNGLEGSGGDRSKTEVDRLDVESALDKKGQPAGRSQSFHEQSTSSREPHPERQPSSPPEERPELSSSAKKAGETENGSRKRFQRVEILKIAEPCPLIDPSQVVVTQGEILVADPVLTPIEKIRRKDQEVARALEEKHRLVAEYYHLPFDDELNPPATPASAGPTSAASIDEFTSGGERDAREVLLAALVQVKSLSDLVNESLTLSEEDAVAAASVATSSRLSPSGSASTSPHQQTTTATSPTPTMATATGTTTTAFPRLSSLASEAIDDLPSVKLLKRLQPPTHKLIAITKSMNHHLTSLLEIIQDRDEERDRLRKEVHRMRAMLPRESAASSGSMRPSLSAAAATTGPGSRPVSFISIEESSGPETTSASERNQESEDDGASNRSPTQAHPTASENIGEEVASVERIIETTIASQDVEANPEQPPSQIGPGNTSPTTFKVPKTEANVSSNDEPEDETSEIMVENTEDDSAV